MTMACISSAARTAKTLTPHPSRSRRPSLSSSCPMPLGADSSVNGRSTAMTSPPHRV
jgi:hypothetical protein